MTFAVDETASVGVGEPVGGLDPDADRLGHAQPGALVQHVAHRPAPQELEHEERALDVLPPVVHGEDVGIGEGGGRLGLGAEPTQEAGVGGQGGVQHLHRHPPLQGGVEGGEHVGGRAASERGFDAVAAGQDPPD